MANWSPLGPFQYKSKIPSAWGNAIDQFLARVPNFSEGSNHTAANQVVLAGAGLRVTGVFQADDATITIQNAKSLTANAGSTVALNGTTTVASGGSVTTAAGSSLTVNGSLTVNSVGTFTKGLSITQTTANAHAVDALGNGSGYGILATGGASGGGGYFVAGGGNNAGVYALGIGTGAGLAGLGGPGGPGLIAEPGTSSTAAVPQCAAKLGGHIEITAADPQPGVAPPNKRVIYGLSVAKAYGVLSVGGGPAPTILDEHNIASVSEVGAGNYEVIFLEPMPSAVYTITPSTNMAGRGVSWNTKTAAGFRLTVYNTADGLANSLATLLDFHVFGRR